MTRLFIPARRATLFIPTPLAGRENLEHLFVLMTDPIGVDKEILLVSVSSIKQGAWYDDSCLLYKGDHEFIKRPSFVSYHHSKIITADSLISGVNKDMFRPCGTVTDEVMALICKGLEESDHLPESHRIFYEDSKL